MKKGNIIAWISTVLGLVIAVIFFLRWNPENLWKPKDKPVTMSEIEQDLAKDYTGLTPGADIFRLSGASDFEDVWHYHNYVTAEPLDIISTGVYSLKSWVDPTSRTVRHGRTYNEKRKPEVITSPLNLWDDYNQYYLLELPDHTYILAQIPPDAASAIAKGKKVTLPIGRKVGMLPAAKSSLTKICDEYQVDTSGVYYAFNDEWQKKHYFFSFVLRFIVSAVLCLTIAVALMTIGNKIFKVEESA